MNFFYLYILQKLNTRFSQKYIFQNLPSVQRILMNFAGLIRVYLRSLAAKFQSNQCRQCRMLKYEFFSSLYPLKTLTRFFQNYIFQNSHFICSFFRFYQAVCLVFLWSMLIRVPATQFCGKLKIHFSDIVTFSWSASQTSKIYSKFTLQSNYKLKQMLERLT